jgi:C-terminal processing protease CtpA/Prc
MKEIKPEKSHKTYNLLLLVLITMAIALVSCQKEPEPEPEPEPDTGVTAEALMLNEWIREGMEYFYLWEQYLPDIDYTKEPDPKKYFYKLLYDKYDHDSWIVDNYDSLVSVFQGVETTTGMVAQPAYLPNGLDVVSIVLYVVPDSPAEDVGIKRGDMIIAIDGQGLTKNNYGDLFYQTTATFEFGSFNGTNLVHDGATFELTAVELSQNPVVHHEVIEYEGAKIGYFTYVQFTAGEQDEWLDELNNVFDEFIAAGVTDVVVDLRYNPGGYGYLAAYIASVLGPRAAMENNEVFEKIEWNDQLYQRWKEEDLNDDGVPDGENSTQLITRLPTTERNLDLSRVYFLTTGGSASASELLMVGLYPYTEVIQIGETTYGKCYGSLTIDDWQTPKRHNWAMQPIVLKYANAEGFTDFINGLTPEPDYYVDEYLSELVPFGSLDDPMLAKALEDITGVAPVTAKSAKQMIDLEPIPVARKPLPERFIDWHVMDGLHQLLPVE